MISKYLGEAGADIVGPYFSVSVAGRGRHWLQVGGECNPDGSKLSKPMSNSQSPQT